MFFETDAVFSFFLGGKAEGEMLHLFWDLFSLTQEAVIGALMTIGGSRTAIRSVLAKINALCSQ